MNKTIALVVLILVLLVGYLVVRGDKAEAPESVNGPEVSTINNDDAARVEINPISHASFVLTLGDTVIFNDPVGDAAAYETYGSPDIILVSDIHGDHLNLDTLAALVTPETVIIAPAAVAEQFSEGLGAYTMVMGNGEAVLVENINIEAMPMYNLPEQGVEIRHEAGRGNGYLLSYDDQRIYIAGDTADIPEMRALEAIDIAFVPMNLPYTMSVDAAADAVIEFAPKQVYPYHYRTPDGLSDVARFKALVNAGNPAVEVVQLEWYPEASS